MPVTSRWVYVTQENPYIRTAILRTLMLKFTVMYYLIPVLFVFQVMNDRSKQDCIHNEADTSMYQNENLPSSSTTLITSRNHKLTLVSVKAGSKYHNIRKLLFDIECIDE